MTVKKQPAQESRAKKIKPTIFPFGLSVSHAGEGFVIINFHDRLYDGDSEESVIIESVAIPMARARDLAEALNQIVVDENG